MAYSTAAELAALTGSTLDTAILEAIIAQADRRVDSILLLYEASGSATDPAVKAASLQFAIAGLYTRYRAEWNTPGSVDEAIRTAEASAKEALQGFAKAKTPETTFRLVNP